MPLERLLSARGEAEPVSRVPWEESFGLLLSLRERRMDWDPCLKPELVFRSFEECSGKRFLQTFLLVSFHSFTTLCIRSTDKATVIGCCPPWQSMVDGPTVDSPKPLFSQSVRFQI